MAVLYSALNATWQSQLFIGKYGRACTEEYLYTCPTGNSTGRACVINADNI